jgi:hypothetical protein
MKLTLAAQRAATVEEAAVVGQWLVAEVNQLLVASSCWSLAWVGTEVRVD